MPTGDGEYIHGTHEEERRRLTRLNELLNPRALASLSVEPGDRVLDVGSGLGLLTRAIACAAGPHGRVLGVERDKVQLASALHALGDGSELAAPIELRRGDAMNLPLKPGEWGAFDIAHCRFVLEHVSDPSRVVDGMAQAVGPGGRVVLEDDDHDLLRLWPRLPEVERLWAAYIDSYRARGNDPFVGRRLVELLVAADLKPLRIEQPRFGACAGEEGFTDYVENLSGILSGARLDIQAAGGVSDVEFESAITSLEAWSGSSDAAFWYVTCWAEGQRAEPGDAA